MHPPTSPPLASEKILEDVEALLGEDGLGVELHPVQRVLPVPEAHDLPHRGLGRHLQAIRQSVPVDDEGMVAGGLKGGRDALKDVPAVVVNEGCFAVHEAGARTTSPSKAAPMA